MPSRTMCRVVPLLLAALWICQSAAAAVKLPALFCDHMVLQQQQPVKVWGWADPGEAVAVQIDSNRGQTKADAAGSWQVTLPPMTAGGPHTLTVSGTNTITLHDVLVGEVWLCSGQSNMEFGIKMTDNAEKEIAAAGHPNIRLFMVPRKIAVTPQNDVDAKWEVCSPQTIVQGGWGGFSAAAYFFGRDLRKALHVPVGLIESCWGGTRIEPWTPQQAFADIPSLKGIYDRVLLADPASQAHRDQLEGYLTSLEKWIAQARSAIKTRQPESLPPAYPAELEFKMSPQTPTGLYNAMIHPLVPFPIRGVIWYQGESNEGEGMLYVDKTKALVAGWRKLWGEGDFPYYYVQIAPFHYGSQAPSVEAEFWQAQAAIASAVPNSAMAATIDIGDVNNIHPKNKQEVGRRLALLALARTYHRPGIVDSGPFYKSMKIDGQHIQITFADAGGGLVSRDGKPLNWFEVIDKDTGGFVPAQARITGPDTVEVSAPGVPHPVAVRYAWSKLADPNLANKELLPAFPFQAGTIPHRNALSLISQASAYKLVYDLDLNKLGADIPYSVDHHAAISGPIDRIAYFLELTGPDGRPQWVWVSMDAFTQDLAKIGIPTAASGAHFQEKLKNVDIETNVPGLTPGRGIPTCNIEFWPNNYSPYNGAKIPNASSQAFDFGDQPTDPMDGYGSMQVGNYRTRQTVFAINNWKAGGQADVGIGNRPDQKNTDWTFAADAGQYPAKRLRVLVKLK